MADVMAIGSQRKSGTYLIFGENDLKAGETSWSSDAKRSRRNSPNRAGDSMSCRMRLRRERRSTSPTSTRSIRFERKSWPPMKRSPRCAGAPTRRKP